MLYIYTFLQVGYCLIMAFAALGNGLIDTVFFDSHGVQLVYALSCAVGLSILGARAASHCNAPHRTATHCIALQRTATHCNIQ